MASSNDPSSQIPDVRASLGPLLIASTISWAFWGLLTMQVIRYYLSYVPLHSRICRVCKYKIWDKSLSSAQVQERHHDHKDLGELSAVIFSASIDACVGRHRLV